MAGMWRGGTLELNPHRAIPEHEEVTSEPARPGGFEDTGRLAITSTSSETKRDSGGAEFVVYRIACVLSGRGSAQWVTRRRFSEFYDLHTRLGRIGDVRATLPSRLNPFSKMSPSVVRAREQGLLRYLNCMLEHCSDSQCVLLAKFLQVTFPTRCLRVFMRKSHLSLQQVGSQLRADVTHLLRAQVNKQLYKLRTGLSAASTPAATPASTPAASVASSPGGQSARSFSSQMSRTTGGATSRSDVAARVSDGVGGVPRSSLRAIPAGAERRGAMESVDSEDSSVAQGAAHAAPLSAWDAGRLQTATPRRAGAHGGRSGDPTADSLWARGGAARRADPRPTCIVCGEEEEDDEGGLASTAAAPAPAPGAAAPAAPAGSSADRAEPFATHFSVRGAGGGARLDTPTRSGGALDGPRGHRVGGYVHKAGVGLFFAEYDGAAGCIVDEIIPGSSAARHGGIACGDVLVAVEGVPVAGATLAAVRERIIGAPGSRVALQLLRPGRSAPFSATLERAVQLQRPRPAEPAPSAVPEAGAAGAAQEPLGQHVGRGDDGGDRGAGGGAWEGRTVYAVCSFEASEEHELSIRRGDVLEVLRRHPSGWWEGRRARRAGAPGAEGGASGWFPSNHVADAPPPAGGSGLEPARGAVPERKRLSGESSASAHSLSRHSTVAASPSATSACTADSISCDVSAAPLSGASAPATPDGEAPLVPAHYSAARSALAAAASANATLGAAHVAVSSAAPAPAPAPAAGGSAGFGGSRSAGESSAAWSEGAGAAGVEAVCAWLAAMELGEYAARFRENKIDADLLGELSDADLERDFGMANRYHRLRLLRKRAVAPPGAGA